MSDEVAEAWALRKLGLGEASGESESESERNGFSEWPSRAVVEAPGKGSLGLLSGEKPETEAASTVAEDGGERRRH